MCFPTASTTGHGQKDRQDHGGEGASDRSRVPLKSEMIPLGGKPWKITGNSG